ncbi:MAG TPA: hypothetical protein VN776_06225, partial [Terracidiphilus sp.]|nr:hypothetical protein [Terracidiphilus sp.]
FRIRVRRVILAIQISSLNIGFDARTRNKNLHLKTTAAANERGNPMYVSAARALYEGRGGGCVFSAQASFEQRQRGEPESLAPVSAPLTSFQKMLYA